MNKPNHFYPNGANRPKVFYPTTSPSSYFFPTPPIFGNHQQFTSPPDSGICDGMNNCHLADSWVNYMNQHVNLPITQITNQIPILNSYMPTALKLHPNEFYQQAVYHKTYLESIYEHQKSIVAESFAGNSQPRQFFRDDLTQLNIQASTNDHQINKSETIYENNLTPQTIQSRDYKEISDDEMHGAKICIKFQDRNKKLDFKKNFRDENRKINGCFYDSENDLSPKLRSESLSAAVAPPKKKWIKNYMTTFAGTFVVLNLLENLIIEQFKEIFI